MNILLLDNIIRRPPVKAAPKYCVFEAPWFSETADERKALVRG